MDNTQRLEQLGHKNGLVHLYEGDGKGKTTAAVGLCVRALGSGQRVLFCQFLKGGETGEVQSLEKLGACIVRAKSGEKFLFQMTAEEREQAGREHCRCFAGICGRVGGGAYDLLVLDEVLDAVNAEVIPLEALLDFLTGRPAGLEVVLTGREPHERLVALADYHTAFTCIRHPFQQGTGARRGIEY